MTFSYCFWVGNTHLIFSVITLFVLLSDINKSCFILFPISSYWLMLIKDHNIYYLTHYIIKKVHMIYQFQLSSII